MKNLICFVLGIIATISVSMLFGFNNSPYQDKVATVDNYTSVSISTQGSRETVSQRIGVSLNYQFKKGFVLKETIISPIADRGKSENVMFLIYEKK